MPDDIRSDEFSKQNINNYQISPTKGYLMAICDTDFSFAALNYLVSKSENYF